MVFPARVGVFLKSMEKEIYIILMEIADLSGGGGHKYAAHV